MTIERLGDAAYFTDSEGVRFRIYDVVYGKPVAHKKRVVPLECAHWSLSASHGNSPALALRR